jgi:hypothetical protein
MKEIQILKKILLNKTGWLSWAIANLIVSSPWIITGFLGFLFNSSELYGIAAAIWSFQMLPIPLESILVFVLTLFFFEVVFKGKIV